MQRLSMGLRGMSRFLFVCIALATHEAQARSCRVTLVPNGSKFNCTTCHTGANGGPRNAFGRDVQTMIGNSSSCNPACWGPALAAMDSDGDGITNGAELQDLDGTWQRGMPNPGSIALVTNPGVRNVPPPTRFRRADANGDGSVNVTDAIVTLEVLFAAREPMTCKSASDSNSDGKLDASDVVFTLTYLFADGPRPPAPSPPCGRRTGGLGCASSQTCA